MSKAIKYIPKLVEGTDDQYTIHTDNFGTMLCGDQLGQEFVKLESYQEALAYRQQCENLEAALMNIKHHVGSFKHMELRYKESGKEKVAFDKLAEMHAIDEEVLNTLTQHQEFKKSRDKGE